MAWDKVQNITGRNIAKIREARGLSQEQFAAKLQILGWDVSRGTIAKIEAQVRRVSDAELLMLAKVLVCSSEALLPQATSEALSIVNRRTKS